MKTDWSEIEPFRRKFPNYESAPGSTWGMFSFAFGKKLIKVMAVDGTETGWEHVSVSVDIDHRRLGPRLPLYGRGDRDREARAFMIMFRPIDAILEHIGGGITRDAVKEIREALGQ